MKEITFIGLHIAYRRKIMNKKKTTWSNCITPPLSLIKYQNKFDKLMLQIERDKILKKVPGNHTAAMAVQMITSLNSYLKTRKI
tara:strand:- start:46 stop:297 length:252 start_codon:yes stop_codon:yes gene_type:complete